MDGGASLPDSTSATQSLLPIKRTSSGSGRPTTNNRVATSTSTLSLRPGTEETHVADGVNPFPPLEKWWAIQCLKDNSDEEIRRWLYYARCPDGDTLQSPYNNQTTPQLRSSPFSGQESKSPFASASSSRTRDSKASFASFPSSGTRDSKSSFASFMSMRTPYSVRSSMTDYSFADVPPLPISKSSSNDEHSTLDNASQRSIRSPSLHKKLPLPPKYFCTSCDTNGFGRKGDWKSHETEFHEHKEEFKCNFCDKVYHKKHRFIRHHQKAHCRGGCQHAETCRTELPKKRAWGCGFCLITLTDRSHRDEHIAGHYEDGKKKSDWNHSLVIAGLLRQEYVVHAWLSLTHHKSSDSSYTWTAETAAKLQAKLEIEGEQTGYDLAREAYDALLQTNSASTEVNPRSSSLAWTGFPVRSASLTSSAPLQSNMTDSTGTNAPLPQGQGQYPLSKFNPRSDSLSHLTASNPPIQFPSSDFQSVMTFQPRHNSTPTHYSENSNAFNCDGIKFPHVLNETESINLQQAFPPQGSSWYPESSTNMDLTTFSDSWGHS